MVTAWAKRHSGVSSGTSEDLDTAAVVKLQPIDRGNHERANNAPLMVAAWPSWHSGVSSGHQ